MSDRPPDQEPLLSAQTSELAAQLGVALRSRGWSIGVAESLTGGLLVQALARTDGSGDWLQGGIVAYATAVKHQLLDVAASKVVSRAAAEQMATGARRALDADLAISVTGVAGPEEQDGEPPGTVWIGVDDGSTVDAGHFTATGSPKDICRATVAEALRRALAAADGPAR